MVNIRFIEVSLWYINLIGTILVKGGYFHHLAEPNLLIGDHPLALLDQTGHYSDLSLKEDSLLAGSKHIFVVYTIEPADCYGYLDTAAHFAVKSSTITNVEVSTTDDFTTSVTH